MVVAKGRWEKKKEEGKGKIIHFYDERDVCQSSSNPPLPSKKKKKGKSIFAAPRRKREGTSILQGFSFSRVAVCHVEKKGEGPLTLQQPRSMPEKGEIFRSTLFKSVCPMRRKAQFWEKGGEGG